MPMLCLKTPILLVFAEFELGYAQYIRIQWNHTFLKVMHIIVMQWWSLETWSRPRDPILRVPVSKVSGLVSVSKAAGLETLNIARKWYSKISTVQWFIVYCICR